MVREAVGFGDRDWELCFHQLPLPQEVKLFGSRLWHLPVEAGRPVELDDGAGQPGRVTRDGLFIPGSDGRWLNIQLLQVGTRIKTKSQLSTENNDNIFKQPRRFRSKK